MRSEYKEYVAEAFNTIRTNMSFLGMDKEIKSILVTSSVKGEGKTMISCNMAKAYSLINKKVLLVDCDLRNPAVHNQLGIRGSSGLTELILAGRLSEADEDYSNYIVHYKENFDVMIAGLIPPNPSEILSSKRIELIFNELSKLYDIIIVDTPPVLMVSDALSLKKYADSLLLVIKYGFTTREMLKQSKQVFNVAGIKPTACVFNEVQGSKKRHLYSDPYYYQSDPKEAKLSAQKRSRSKRNMGTVDTAQLTRRRAR